MNAWNRNYQIDMFPTIWDHVEEVIRAEVAVVTVQVYEEIQKKDDELAAWCAERRDIFFAIDDAHLANLTGIMDRHPRMVSSGSGRNFADPWVIALAQCFEPPCCVVTEEGLSRNANNPKIPFVCDQEGLPSCTFNRFLRDTGWRERT